MKKSKRRINKLLHVLAVCFIATSLTACDLYHHIEKTAQRVNNFEAVALNLAKENHELHAEINQLKFQVQTLETQNSFLQIKLSKQDGDRQVASFSSPVVSDNDLLKF